MEKLFRMAEFGLKGNTQFSGRDRETPRITKEESERIQKRNFEIKKENLQKKNSNLRILIDEYRKQITAARRANK